MPIKCQAEVHHLVRDFLFAVENVVNGLGAAARIGQSATIQRRIVVRRVALVIGHHVNIVNIRQHTVVVGVITAVGGSIGQDLVRHGLAHFLEEGDEVGIVRRGGAIIIIGTILFFCLGRIGGILPVYVETVGSVQHTDGYTLVHEGFALLGISGHLGPAVGVLAPATHLELHFEPGVLGLVLHELLRQPDGFIRNLKTHTVLLVLEAHVTHVDVGEVLHFLQGGEEVLAGVLRVVNFNDGGNADARQALGVVRIGIVGIRIFGLNRRVRIPRVGNDCLGVGFGRVGNQRIGFLLRASARPQTGR